MNIQVQLKRVNALIQHGDRKLIAQKTGYTEKTISTVLAADGIFPSTIPIIKAALDLFEQREKEANENSKRIKSLKHG